LICQRASQLLLGANYYKPQEETIMKNSVYAPMMVSLAIMAVLVFTAGAVMAASQDEMRTMGSGSMQGNVNDQTMTRMPSQQQTDVSGGVQRGVTGQTETSTPSHARTDVPSQTGTGVSDPKSQIHPGPGMAVQPGPSTVTQPGMVTQPSPGMAVQPSPGVVTQPMPGVAAQPGAPMQQPAAVTGQNPGTPAIVARVDRPDNCLRIRSGPSKSGNVIGCAKMGDQLFLTGVFSDDGRWAQLNNNGWVYYNQIQSSLKPAKKHVRQARRPSVSEEDFDTWEYPAATYAEEPYYDSGYSSYGYGPGYYGGYRGFRRGPGLYGGYGTLGFGPGIGFGFRFR
jgi:hypothetical protein